MELPLSLVPEESDFSIESEEESEKKLDPFQPIFPTWSSRYNCLLAYCCFVLSFFSTLKFCESVGKYGFIIFLPYWLFNACFGGGVVLIETLFGRYVIGNVARAWDMCPLSRGVLWCLFGTTSIAVIYDHLTNAFLLKYFFSSFGKTLPWETCNPEWAGINCYQTEHKQEAMAKCIRKYSQEYCQNLTWESAATQFWKVHIQGLHNAGDVAWTIFCLAVSVMLSFFINWRGIRSVEKWFPIFLYPTVALWLMNACVCLVIPTSLIGLKKLCEIRWEKLFDIKLWLDGFDDVLYILGLGKLTLSFISSHGRFDDNILLDVIIASFGGLFFSVLITTPILSIIAATKADDRSQGIFLNVEQVFIYMSEAITHYPYPKALWSILSFLNWFFMSTSAQVLSVLAICEATEGVLNCKRNIFFWVLSAFSVLSFSGGLVILLIPGLQSLKLGRFITIVIWLNTVTWQYGYGISRLNKDYHFMMGRPLPIFMKANWIGLFVLPIALVLLNVTYSWQDHFNTSPYIYTGIPVAIYFTSMFANMILFFKNQRSLHEMFQPNYEWGPQNPILRKSRAAFDSTTAPREILYRQELCNRAFTRPPDISVQNIVQLI